MSRVAWLILALLLSLPALSSSLTVFASTAFLVEFLSGGHWPLLSMTTLTPEVRALPAPAWYPGLVADMYVSPALARRTGLVLVHGIAPRGKDDPHLRQAAALLARAGWAVAVPTIDGLTALRLRPEDSRPVVASIDALDALGYRPVAVLGVSLGAAPALEAAGDPRVARAVSAVLALGGYASAVEMLRYTLTGAFEFGGVRGQRRPLEEAVIAQFAQANADLVDAPARRLVENRDPGAASRLLGALPPRTRQLLDALSPEQNVGRITAPLFLIHGRDDPTVPFTETLRLDQAARAAGRRVTTAIVGALGHVDPDERARMTDLIRVWADFYAFRVYSTLPS